ncbi:MAG: HAMP domain-containing sensor histidine kinase [Bacteroidales bacterium]
MKKIRWTYRKKLFTSFFALFAAFALIITVVQVNREKEFKKEILRSSLDTYTRVIHEYLRENNFERLHQMDSVVKIKGLFPNNMRLSIIDREGRVLYDNEIADLSITKNHLERPEIAKALINHSGAHIRHSQTLGLDFFYYARFFDTYFIRVALPYDVNIKNYLQNDHLFLYFMLLLFFAALWIIILMTDRFGRSVSGLKNFVYAVENQKLNSEDWKFPETELGNVGQKIVKTYQLLQERKEEVNLLQDKLIRHFHYSQEGICIFSPQKEKIYANALFVQYMNCILEEPTFDTSQIFKNKAFMGLSAFFSANTPVQGKTNQLPSYASKIYCNGRSYAVRLLIFYDNSFEISLNDITQVEQNKNLKQEMTNNIAHELKTPVSSIRGYLETVLETPMVDPQQQKFFLERAYMQSLRLSDLIQDVSLLNKIEEASELFSKENIEVKDLIEEVRRDLQSNMDTHKVHFENRVDSLVKIHGNRTLIYALFRNLIENSLNYAGNEVSIHVEVYDQDSDFYYFSYYDTGCGVKEEHLSRIFDRFYRVEQGRSRKDGGSGLGLAIVKNAVLFHAGQIAAKNRKDKGLELVFSLQK